MKPRCGDDIENRHGITTDSKLYAAGYDEGFSYGYRVGVCDGWARGFDEGLEEAETQRR
jgi:hypothetical protein